MSEEEIEKLDKSFLNNYGNYNNPTHLTNLIETDLPEDGLSGEIRVENYLSLLKTVNNLKNILFYKFKEDVYNNPYELGYVESYEDLLDKSNRTGTRRGGFYKESVGDDITFNIVASNELKAKINEIKMGQINNLSSFLNKDIDIIDYVPGVGRVRILNK